MDPKNTTFELPTNAYSLTTFGVRFCEWCSQEVGSFAAEESTTLSGVSVYPACTSVGHIRCF